MLGHLGFSLAFFLHDYGEPFFKNTLYLGRGEEHTFTFPIYLYPSGPLPLKMVHALIWSNQDVLMICDESIRNVEMQRALLIEALSLIVNDIFHHYGSSLEDRLWQGLQEIVDYRQTIQ